jgi:hypothetical protein
MPSTCRSRLDDLHRASASASASDVAAVTVAVQVHWHLSESNLKSCSHKPHLLQNSSGSQRGERKHWRDLERLMTPGRYDRGVECSRCDRALAVGLISLLTRHTVGSAPHYYGLLHGTWTL